MMNIQYKAFKKDFINLKLFLASTTPRVMKQLNAQRRIGQAIFIVLALANTLIYLKSFHSVNLIVSLFAIAVIFLYPRFNYWLYKQTLSYQFNQIEKRGDNAIVNLSIDDAVLIVKDDKGQYSMNTSDIIRIVEVPDYFFINIRQEMALLIPKDQLSDPTSFRLNLKECATLCKVPYIEKNGWSNYFYSKNSKIQQS